MSKKLSNIISLLLVFTLLLTACGGGNGNGTINSNGEEASSGNNVSEEVKDSLNFGISAEPIGLNPYNVVDAYSYMPIYQIFDTLVAEDKDGNIVPRLAKDWVFSDDRTEITFNLHENVKFHNGDVLTSEDAVYSINKAVESSFTAKITGTIEKAEVIDDLSFKIILKHAYEPILSCLTSANASIVSKTEMEADEDGFNRNPVGTGAYKFVEWSNGEKITLTRFDEYYRGSAPIKDLTFRIFTDTNTAVIALENGEIDILDSPPTGDRDNLSNNNNLNYYETDSSMFTFIAFNNEKGTFSNEKLRQAVSYAINRDDIIMGAVEGVGTPIEAPIAPSAFGYPKDFKNNKYDPEKARELIKEAGYPNGLNITLKCTENSLYSNTAQVIQEQLRQVGMNTELAIMEKGAFLEDLYTTGEFEIAIWAIISMIPDADYSTYSRFHSEMFGGGNNFIRSNIPGMDNLLEEARVIGDPALRESKYLEISELVKVHAPLIPLFAGKQSIVANNNLNGIYASSTQKYYVFDYSWK
jgi:peptide/nickel transport system substrate-binding protein